MQDALRSVALQHDLTAHEIHRVAEIANRGVQLELQKTATDKRFKFALADPFALTGSLTKEAIAPAVRSGVEGTIAKVAALGGDPFAAPDLRSGDALSLYHQPLPASLELEARRQKLAAVMAKLRAAEFETSRLLEESKAAEAEIYRDAVGSHKIAVDDAVEMVMSGITLPSLYQALYAAVSGSRASDEERTNVDKLARLIIDGLKERGIPNHRMGFRYKVNLKEIDSLSTDDLIALCKRAVGCNCDGTAYNPNTLTIETQKSAARYLEGIAELHALDKDQHPFEEANKWLGARGAITQYPLQQAYLDEKQTGNSVTERRMLNGDSEFVVAVKDLIGAQDRMYRNHNAAEYLGLKLEEIRDLLASMAGNHEKTAELLEQIEKDAGLMGAISNAVGNAVGKVSANPLVKGLAETPGMAANNGLGIVGGGLNAVAAKQQIDMNRQEASRQKRQESAPTALA